ncbi:unnamed protein product [Prorocentrum cordatum]|uniref:Uncharacterized protein n=1 Tax=Prorocentrum cordatum TaxID=2364126 RepID=A0ABN9VCJ0_9DINO|nr:unnamed protein product [Polarella glacialis]
MPMMSTAVFVCLAVAGNAVARDFGFGDELGEAVEIDQNQLLGDLESLEGKPSTRQNSAQIRRRKAENLTSTLDEMIPVLEADFKSKTQHLKVALAYFKEKQHDMEVARRAATDAMKALRQEADRRRKTATERKAAKDRERLAVLEAKRAAKEAMVKKAQALMGAKGHEETEGYLGPVSLGIMVDVLMSLPNAVENPIFMKRLGKAKDQITGSIQDFLNITRRKTAKFVLASSKASDVELSFLMARFFHEASFRVKAMQSDGEKVARDLNVVMPRELRQNFLPIVRQLRSQAVPLRVNASSLASATLADACSQISDLMANISNYNAKLNTLHSALHNVWQMSELMLPHMSRIYPMKTAVIDTVKDFMSLATTQTAGLQEAADEIVTNVGPVVSERMQCTWSAASSPYKIRFITFLAAFAGYFFL